MMDKSIAEQLAVQNGMVRRGRPVDIQIWSATNDDLLNFANACYAAGQDDVSAWVESQRNDIPATGQEFADAIRARTKEQA